MATETFHRRGHHVQSAHGRRAALAADDSHLLGGMICLMPTAEDARRLAIGGGEKAAELHLTLMFLGDDMTSWTDDAKRELINDLEGLASEVPGPVQAKVFGVAHWNGNGDTPAWVWNVGDVPPDPETGERPGPPLSLMHTLAVHGLEFGHNHPDVPAQHTPWQPHICAAYTKDTSLIKTLEQRLGPVTFDRMRVSFGEEDHDIPLGPGLTAAAGPLRRDPTEVELHCGADFTTIHDDWERAVGSTTTALQDVLTAWRADLRKQIIRTLTDDTPEDFSDLSVNTLQAEDLLRRAMVIHARRAGEAMQREAESQGVDVPEWKIPEDTDDDALAAAIGGRRLISSVAKLTSDLMANNLVQAAKRKISALLHTSGSPEQIASEVGDVLREDPGVQASVGTAMTTAQNVGRQAVLEVAPEAQYYASEILDRNTCGPCKEVDGEEFATLALAIKSYPVMGYKDCIGPRYGNACRGLIIARWHQPVSGETASAGTDIYHLAAEDSPAAGPKEADTMPWHKVEGHSECPGDKPWAVVKDSDNSVAGCHATEAEADDQLAALYANEQATAEVEVTVTDDDLELGGKPNPGTDKDKRLKDNKPAKSKMTLGEAMEAALAAKAEAAASAAETNAPSVAPWKGPLCVEGKVTGDGREFCPGALTWSDLPVPLRWNRVDSHGGEPRTEAVNVGRIDKIYRDGDLIMGEGVLDLGDEDGRRVHAKIQNKMLRGVSIDADSISDADVEYVMPEGMPTGDDADPIEMLFTSPEKILFHGGRIRAATLCDIPAFAEAYIELTGPDGEVMVASAADGNLLAGPGLPARRIDGLVAHGGPDWTPPAAWFKDPQLSLPTGITVTDEGRVYGHAAMWGACHIGHQDVCVQPPHEESHPYYMTGELYTDGGPVSVGQITVATGHASLSVGAQAAAEHYDHTGHAVADVAVGNDAHGIWVAGAIRPGADPRLVHELRAAGQVSGDWRRIGGKLRLVGLLAVNIPGFPVPKTTARVASGQQVALVAAGRPTVYHGKSDAEVQSQAMRSLMDRLFEEIHGKE